MDSDKKCWLCGRNGTADPLDRHHIFRGKNRRNSEKYGLTVYLCHSSCHLFGENAVHNNVHTRHMLEAWGQDKAMREQGWTKAEFIQVFGRNYLED